MTKQHATATTTFFRIDWGYVGLAAQWYHPNWQPTQMVECLDSGGRYYLLCEGRKWLVEDIELGVEFDPTTFLCTRIG
jgi:hypothetical protein